MLDKECYYMDLTEANLSNKTNPEFEYSAKVGQCGMRMCDREKRDDEGMMGDRRDRKGGKGNECRR